MSFNKSEKLFILFVVMFVFFQSAALSQRLSPYSSSRYPISGLRYTNGYRYGPRSYAADRRYGPGVGSGAAWGETGFYPQQGCPVCDSSVYSYCTHKLTHDTCCCGDEYYTDNAFECQYTDCNYIHANSCQESNLISSCCCDEPYRSFNPLYSRYFDKK